MTLQEQLEALCHGVTHIHSRAELEAKLKSGRQLRIKLGFDPSSPNLHIGHGQVLDKVAQFQKFGHKAIIIIGDYTSRIGDPTGRSKTRVPLEPEQIAINAKTYIDQVFKILDPDKTEIRSNSEWFDKLNYADVLKLNAKISVAQLLEREDFKKRYTEGHSITLTEFQYPLMQGYDSVQIKADVELGGTDQLFNNLVGRDLQRAEGMEPQVVMVVPLIVGTDGAQKMGKSLNNAVGILEPPEEIFGKTMSISDETMKLWREMLAPYYGLAPQAPEHPMEAKKELAQAFVARFHGQEAATRARADFEQKFSKRDLADIEMPEHTLGKDPVTLIKLLQDVGAVTSGSEARRLVTQGGVKLEGNKLTEPTAPVTLDKSSVLQVGKKFFVRLKV